MAMILAAGSLLGHFPDDPQAQRAGQAIQQATFDSVTAGIRTVDIGGQSSTSEFTDAVIERVRTKLEIWSSL